MREIKFRAWDIKNEIMTPAPMSKVYRNKYSLFGDIYLLEKEAFEDTVRVELMQYTGLKDYHGDEIYEGDILYRQRTHRNKNGTKGKVEFKNSTWALIDKEGDSPLSNIAFNTEVLGNIYEHSHLLEGDGK